MKKRIAVLVALAGLIVSAAGTARAAQIDHSFLCYSAFQTNPGVWQNGQATSLLAQGYWSPYAVSGNVAGGTNIGSYHLVCNLATGQSAGGSLLDESGRLIGPTVAPVFKSIVGVYPVAG